jgi:hypothetical protein
MTLKPLALLTAAALAVPAAVAASGQDKPPKTGPGCKPKITVVLKGTLTTDPGVGSTSFGMDVTGANKHGKNLVTTPTATNVTVTVDVKTKIRRNGKKTVDALQSGDRAMVVLRECKADLPLAAGDVGAVPATRVTAHPPQSASS